MTTATLNNVNGICPMSDAAYDLIAFLPGMLADRITQSQSAKRATFLLRYGSDVIAMIRLEADCCDASIRDAVADQIELCGSTMFPRDWSVSRAVNAVRNACKIERECDPV